MVNLKRLSNLLPSDVDGAIIMSSHNRRYFTGFHSSAGVLLVTRGKSVFLTDFRYIEAARRAIENTGIECECMEYSSLNTSLRALVQDMGLKWLLVEDDAITCSERTRLTSACTGAVLCGGRLDSLINSLRMVKSERELAKIRAAQGLTDYAFGKITSYIRPGITERDIALELEFIMRRQGAERAAFDFIVVSGANSSLPHGVPTEKQIEHGDFITMDFGAVVDGWHSDMTRTVAVGEVSAEQRCIYGIVLRAQCASLDMLKPGVSCVHADAAARDIIAAEGYGDYFGHGTGHGVGVEIHESPRLSPTAGDTVLASGNVVTVEPGIYLPGRFGVRIEDLAVITTTGYENLTSSPKDLLIIS